MYTPEEKARAVKLYVKYGLKATALGLQARDSRHAKMLRRATIGSSSSDLPAVGRQLPPA